MPPPPPHRHTSQPAASRLLCPITEGLSVPLCGRMAAPDSATCGLWLSRRPAAVSKSLFPLRMGGYTGDGVALSGKQNGGAIKPHVGGQFPPLDPQLAVRRRAAYRTDSELRPASGRLSQILL